ncbi:MAG: DUF4421 family protein [Bacteroidota bacterium]
MKYFLRLILVLFSLLLFPYQGTGQDTLAQKTIWDIPHKTAWEKFMWVHRTAVYTITRTKKTLNDPSYIKAYPKKFIISIPLSARLMHFDMVDWGTNKQLQYTPNFKYEVGIGLSSRWSTFITNTGIAVFNGNKNEKGVTKYRDYQLNLYGQRTTSDISYQNYQGFYIRNTNEFIPEKNDTFEVRKDVRAQLFATSTYYIFNYKKFSYRSTFAFTETQLKSAGSFLLGGYYTIFGVSSDSSLVSGQFAPFFDTLSLINKGSAQTFGLNGGYIYTYVKENFYATTSIVPGFGLEQTTYNRFDNELKYRSPYNPSAKISLRFGFGYDTGKFYYGLMGIYDYFFSFSKTNCTFNYNTGKARIFVGYRFNFLKTERRLLRKLKLIDYPGDPHLK